MIITIPGTPIAKKRPRFANRGKRVAVINQQETEEGLFYLVARSQIPGDPTGEPLKVSMLFVLPRPKSHYNSKGVLKCTAPSVHSKKPDLDNLVKFALDVLNELAWNDDSQVCQITATKKYASREANAGGSTVISIEHCGQDPINTAQGEEHQ